MAPFDYSRLDTSGGEDALAPQQHGCVAGQCARQARRCGLRTRQRSEARASTASRICGVQHDAAVPGRRAAPATARGTQRSVKAPLVYVKVAVRNWEPWVKAGVHEVTNPMGFYSRIKLDYPVSLGDYRFARTPREPIGLHLVHVPTPGLTGADQRAAWRTGRAILYATSYQEFEKRLIDELTRILGHAGFNAQRDIAAISVYRWGHGYASGSNSLYDKDLEPPQTEIAHQRFGNIAIANSDAGGDAYAHVAIDEAHRAVDELLR